MLTMWVRSVSTVMWSLWAICLLSRPSASACITSLSRRVSRSMALWASICSWRWRLTMRSISITSSGESRASPALRRLTASTMSPMAAALCSTPEAPASTARAKRAGSRLALRTSVITSPPLAANSSMRSNPSPSGRARSQTATSVSPPEPLRNWRASASVPAWPTTSNSGSRSNMNASACRNEAWSSTSKMRVLSLSTPPSALTSYPRILEAAKARAPLMVRRASNYIAVFRVLLHPFVLDIPCFGGIFSFGPRKRDAAEHPRAPARLALHLDLPTEVERPLEHGVAPHARPGELGVEAATVVADPCVERLTLDADLDPDVPGARVAPDVRERLLDDAHDLPPPGQPLRHPFPARDLDLVGPPGHAAVEVHEVLHRLDEGGLLRLVQPQLEDRPAQALHGAPEGVGGVPEGRGTVGARHLEDLYLLQGVDDVLEDAVVELAGYPVALGIPDLPQRPLRPQAPGDVVGHDAHRPPSLVGHGADADLDVHQPAVLAPVLPQAEGEPSLPQRAPHVAVHALPVVGAYVVDGHALELLRLVPEGRAQRGVRLEHAQGLQVEQEYALGRLLHDVPVELLALAQVPRRPRPLYGLPAAVGHGHDQPYLLVRPAPRRLPVYGHPRNEPPILVQRRADDGPYPRHPVRLEVGPGHPPVLLGVVYHVRLVQPRETQGLHAELGHGEAADDARHAPGKVAGDAEVVLVGIDLGVGAAVGADVLAEHPGGRGHHLVRVGDGLQRPVQVGQERGPLLGLLAAGGVRGDAARGVGGAVRAPERELYRDVGVDPVVLPDGLLGLQRGLGAQNLEVVLPEGVGRFLGEEVVVGLADDPILRRVEQLLEAAVHEDVTARCVLHVDHGRRVVQDGLEVLPALPERLLRQPALGDVAGVDDDAPDGRVVQQVFSDGLQMAPGAPFVPDPVLHGREGAGDVAVLPEQPRHAVAVLGVDQAERVEPDPILRREAEHSPDGGALVGDGAVLGEHEDDVRGVLDEGAESLLARPQGVLGPPPLRDVRVVDAEQPPLWRARDHLLVEALADPHLPHERPPAGGPDAAVGLLQVRQGRVPLPEVPEVGEAGPGRGVEVRRHARHARFDYGVRVELGEGGEPRELLLGLLLLRDVPLGAPDPHQQPVLDDTGHVVEDHPLVAVPAGLPGLAVFDPVPGPHRGPQELDVVRVRAGQQVADPGADEVGGALETVHLGHRVVALGEVGVAVEVLQLLPLRQVGRHRRLQLEAPDPLGALIYKSPVALLAPADLLLDELLLGDVVLDTLPVEGAPLRVANEGRLVPDPDHPPVAGELAVLRLERLAGPVGALVLGEHPLAVVRVHDVQPVA